MKSLKSSSPIEIRIIESELIDYIFRIADEDGNGSISYDEFLHIIRDNNNLGIKIEKLRREDNEKKVFNLQ
jgi:Ca2+-binding EF-hand superfamily protein